MIIFMVVAVITPTMDNFINNLEKEIEKKLKTIESADLNIMKKSLETSQILVNAFQKVKEFIGSYTFKDEAEEIDFFKEIKPRLFYRLLSYCKIYNIEMNRPVGVDSQRAYLIDEIKAINRYNAKRSDFVHYYRSGLTHLDSIYYLRGRIDTALYLELFYYEREPMCSTNCDFKFARLKANEMLMVYLNKELEALENRQLEQSLPRVRITWVATKQNFTSKSTHGIAVKSLVIFLWQNFLTISRPFLILNWTLTIHAHSAICVSVTIRHLSWIH